MNGCSPIPVPSGAAIWQEVTRFMDVVLHVGAHRTATASFQEYLRRHAGPLAGAKMGVWGPRRTHTGLYKHALQDDRTAATMSRRMNRRLERMHRFGLSQLVISDANMIGTVGDNIRACALYPDAGARISRFARVFGHRVTRVLICPRSLELYWCSALARAVHTGSPVPERSALRRIAMARRGWRVVITDIANALPGVRVTVLPFERYKGAPHALARLGLGIDLPTDDMQALRNQTPTLPELRRALNAHGTQGSVLPFGMGRWNPFLNGEHAALRELYADDLMWLAAGADGLATQTEDRLQDEAGTTPPLQTKPKGRCDELQERQLARPR